MVNIPWARDTQNAEKEEHANEQYPQGQTSKHKETEEKRKGILSLNVPKISLNSMIPIHS